MINVQAAQHVQRLKLQTIEKLKRKDLGDWVVNNTFLNGRKFTTKGHEYQAKIMEDESPEVVIKKSAQIGISEMSLRMTLGLVSIMPNFSAIYTMPTATLAGVYTKTRLDAVMVQQLVDRATTADTRYTPSSARREVGKHETQAMYESWRKAYRALKRKHPGKSDVWCSQQIAKTHNPLGRDASTIKKHMLP